MTLKQLFAYYGSEKEIAYRLGYTAQAIDYWIKKNRIPFRAQKLAQADSGGKLVARKPKGK